MDEQLAELMVQLCRVKERSDRLPEDGHDKLAIQVSITNVMMLIEHIQAYRKSVNLSQV